MIDIDEINDLKFRVIKEEFCSIGKMRIRKGYIFGVVEFFRLFFYYLMQCPIRYKKVKKHNGVLYLYVTKNGEKSIAPVFHIEKNGIFFRHIDLPLYRAYLYALPYIFVLIGHVMNASKERRRSMRRYFASFWSAYGYYILARKVINFYDLKAIVVPNDHGELFRAFMSACNDVSIDSYYLQHASVTDKFPKLICKYALLDGEDALMKYKTSEWCRKIFVVGGTRFDVAKSITMKQCLPSKVLGIALTLSDTIDDIEKFCFQIKGNTAITNTYSKVIIRPHPRMNLRIVTEICEKYGYDYSDSADEDSLFFLRNIDFLVANESSIHLDAAIMGVPSVLYSPMSNLGFRDHYGYVKDGLVERIDDFEKLCGILTSNSIARNLEFVKRFNQSVGTSYEGDVSRVVNEIINNCTFYKPFSHDCFVKKGDVYWLA